MLGLDKFRVFCFCEAVFKYGFLCYLNRKLMNNISVFLSESVWSLKNNKKISQVTFFAIN